MLASNQSAEYLDSVESVDIDASEVAKAARQDPDLLAGIAMPEVFEYCWPPVFRAAWFWLIGNVDKIRSSDRLALGLPRGFGKTTLIKVFILYCILFTRKKFILVISNTAGHAENILSDVIDMLEESNIKRIFGDWKLGVETNRTDLKKFGFRGRTIILAGLGAGGSVRGLNLKNARPDVIIFEDIQKREEADSQQVSEDLYKWMLGTAMKAKDPKGCLTLFIGNMYPTPHSILKKLKANSKWIKFIAGGILEDGTSLWEELQPINQLLDEFEADLESGHPEIFYSEVLNDENAALNNLIDFGKLPKYPYQDDDIPQGKFIVIDPSNDKHNSDAVSVGYFEMHEGKPVAREIDEGRMSPLDTIKSALKLCMKWNCRAVFIESNAYQYSLKFWSNFVVQQLGIEGITFQEIYSGRVTKNTRILTMFKAYIKGEILVHPSCSAQVHAQASAFQPLKTNNVDGVLDLLTYAPRVCTEFPELIQMYTLENEQTWDAIDQLQFSETAGAPF